MKKGVLLWAAAGLALVAGAVAVCCLLAGGDKPDVRPSKESPHGTAQVLGSRGISEIRELVRSHAQRSGRAQRQFTRFAGLDSSMFGNLPAADRKLCEALQEALDADDAEKAISISAKLMASNNPEVRSHAVDALGWFGAEALPELTVLMGDTDESVAQSAINAWESGVSEIDDAAVRLKISGMAMKAIFSRDALQSIGAQFSSAATELIDAGGDANDAFDKRVEVVQSVVDMIDSSNLALSDVGRELYEEITGHEWLNIAEAERYLDDPDNYEPPAESEADESKSLPSQ